MPTFRIKEAASLLGVSADTLRRWAEGGRIETITDTSGRLAVDGVALARFAQELAESAGHGEGRAVVAQSVRNRFSGLVSRVVRDTVMAQVEIQAGPHRFVSLLSREAADELGLEPGMLAVAAVKATNVSIEIPKTSLYLFNQGVDMRRFVFTIAALTAVAVAGCSSSSSSSPNSTSSSPATGTITVFAAASLTGAFTQIGKQFEAAHKGDTVKFSFGPSSGLATEITSGAPADVFASASPKNMQEVVSAGDASNPQNFVKNTMEVAVPPNNPAKVTSVNDLAKKSVKVALCQPQVPCGAVAAEVFKNAGITVKPVTLQPDVKSVLTQVELGNVDAGMVYVTDVLAAGSKVKGVTIPASDNASTLYPIATISSSKHTSVAQAFMSYVLSPAGQQVLTAAGFQKP